MPWFSRQAHPQPAASSFFMQDSGMLLGFTSALLHILRQPCPPPHLPPSLPHLDLCCYLHCLALSLFSCN